MYPYKKMKSNMNTILYFITLFLLTNNAMSISMNNSGFETSLIESESSDYDDCHEHCSCYQSYYEFSSNQEANKVKNPMFSSLVEGTAPNEQPQSIEVQHRE